MSDKQTELDTLVAQHKAYFDGLSRGEKPSDIGSSLYAQIQKIKTELGKQCELTEEKRR